MDLKVLESRADGLVFQIAELNAMTTPVRFTVQESQLYKMSIRAFKMGSDAMRQDSQAKTCLNHGCSRLKGLYELTFFEPYIQVPEQSFQRLAQSSGRS